MKKGLLITLIAGAIALFGFVSTVSALGPTITQIPDIVVGDMEDNTVTVDNNIFRFPDAFDFSDFVTDPNTDSSWIIWRFEAESDMGTPSTDYSVNTFKVGDAGYDNLTSVPVSGGLPTGPGTELLATFRNETTSPSGGTPPFSTPVGDYVRQITFYASDGDVEDSTTFEIRIADQGYDEFGFGFEDVLTYEFEGSAEGWTWSGALSGFGSPTSNVGTTALGIDAGSSADTYAFFFSDSDAVPYFADNVYRVQWTMTTDQTDASLVPGVRLMLQQEFFVSTAMYRVGNFNDNDQNIPADGSPINITQYVLPPDLSVLQGDEGKDDLYLEFDLFNFEGGNGLVAMEEVVVDRFNVGAISGTTGVYTYTDFSTWTWGDASGTYSVPTHGLDGDNIYVESGLTAPTGGGYFGQYDSPATDVIITADKLYRVRYTVTSDAANETERQTLPSYRLRVYNEDFENFAMIRNFAKTEITSAVPDGDGEVYTAFLLPVTPSGGFDASEDALRVTFDMLDFEDAASGRYTVEQVVIDSLDPPTP
jgi:hypothetical protein